MKTYAYLLFLKIKKMIENMEWGLSRIPGFISLSTFIQRNLNPKKEILVTIQNNKMYLNSKDKGISAKLLRDGIHEPYGTELIKNLIKKDTIFLDLGANIGYYTLITSNIIKTGKIYAFEPLPQLYELLSKNININNCFNVFLYKKAVSNVNGHAKIFFKNTNSFTPSLSKENVPEHKKFITIETVTLDSFFKDLSLESKNIFIKMDIQGAEGLVIEGAEKLLKYRNIKIFMEFWPYGLQSLGTDPYKLLNKLKNKGFRFKVVEDEYKNSDFLTVEQVNQACEKSPAQKIDILLEK